jgi:mRNA interferase MazF
MSPGDVILIALPQVGGVSPKLRPALVLALLPGPFQNVLICGISTQLQNVQREWDELLRADDSDFADSGLHRDSAIRLSYLYAADKREIVGTIGRIDPNRLRRLCARLAGLLIS